MNTVLMIDEALAIQAKRRAAEDQAHSAARATRVLANRASASLHALGSIELSDNVDESVTSLTKRFDEAINAVRALYAKLGEPFESTFGAGDDVARMLWVCVAEGADAGDTHKLLERILQSKDPTFRGELSRLCADLDDAARLALGRWLSDNHPTLRRRVQRSEPECADGAETLALRTQGGDGVAPACAQAAATEAPAAELRDQRARTFESSTSSRDPVTAVAMLFEQIEAEATVKNRLPDPLVAAFVLEVLRTLLGHRGTTLPVAAFVAMGIPRSTLHEASTVQRWGDDVSGSGTPVRSYSVDRVIRYVVSCWSPRRLKASDRSSD